jgi:flagellar operon protein (TIGR03826 family)
MPDVRNCRRCGRIYNYIGGPPICQICKELDEIDFKNVKEYLYKNPGATLSEVSTVLEISVEKIKTYLKEGRLEIIGTESNMVLECESCGKAIRTGRLCDRCSAGLSRDFKSTASQLSSSISATDAANKKTIGMRYLNKDEKK